MHRASCLDLNRPIDFLRGNLMKNIKNFIKRLIKDESGQGATEYILLLVVVVAIAMLFRNQIQQIITQKISELGGAIGSFNVQ
jgi:Flp pilus assembly pilin Flp